MEEGLHLEFKTKHDPTRSEMTNTTDRKNWGKCLSAFSNAEGGVMVGELRPETGKGAERFRALAGINDPE